MIDIGINQVSITMTLSEKEFSCGIAQVAFQSLLDIFQP
tara:strand:+ start:901 stop:1017 length:117 start_codon:yes stop_codon:yes gene_type:complete